jgi:transcription antitermination factor NusG
MKVDTWFAIQVKPNRELKVAALLEMKGYRCLCPTYRISKAWSDRAATAEFPLFPGYLFCSFTSEVFGKVVITPGVIRMLGFGPKPCEIPPEDIAALQRVQECSIPRSPWAYLKAGARVRIGSGPLCGIEGIYSGDSDHRRLILSVDLLQRSVAVQLDGQVEFRIVNTPCPPTACKGAHSEFASSAARLVS